MSTAHPTNSATLIGRISNTPRHKIVSFTESSSGETIQRMVVTYNIIPSTETKNEEPIPVEQWMPVDSQLVNYIRTGRLVLLTGCINVKLWNQDGNTARSVNFKASNLTFMPTNNRKDH